MTSYEQSAAEYHLRAGLGDMDPAFLPLYEQCRGQSMTSGERMFGLFKAIEYVARARVPGAIVECGVWRGGSMMLAALTLLANDDAARDLYLFDTFDGLPRPDAEVDVDLWGNRAIDGWLPHRIDDESSNYARADLDTVRANMASTLYAHDRVFFVQGMVERTIPQHAPERIAVLRLDTDWYASTRHELTHLYPRLVPGGVLIVDDYGHFRGARRAVDEYIAEHALPLLLHRLDYTGRVAVKRC
jgi:hypothetical protein